MAKAFSIAELVIVVAVIGILAALAVPTLHSHSLEAKEAATRENLQLLRGAIEFYAARHAGVAPGYANNNLNNEPTAEQLQTQLTVADRCLLQIPGNPFNEMSTVRIIGDNEAFPTEATGQTGWMYQPATKIIRVDSPGTDSHGIRYFDY